MSMRFNNMVILQTIRAEKLGYDKDIAGVIGYAKAVQYSIFKNRRWGGGGKRKKNGENKNANIETDKSFNPDVYEKLPEFNIYKDIFNRIWLKKNGKSYFTEKDFNKWKMRIGEEDYRKLRNWATRIIDNTDELLLKVESRFYNHVYKVHRDKNILLD